MATGQQNGTSIPKRARCTFNGCHRYWLLSSRKTKLLRSDFYRFLCPPFAHHFNSLSRSLHSTRSFTNKHFIAWIERKQLMSKMEGWMVTMPFVGKMRFESFAITILNCFKWNKQTWFSLVLLSLNKNILSELAFIAITCDAREETQNQVKQSKTEKEKEAIFSWISFIQKIWHDAISTSSVLSWNHLVPLCSRLRFFCRSNNNFVNEQ